MNHRKQKRTDFFKRVYWREWYRRWQGVAGPTLSKTQRRAMTDQNHECVRTTASSLGEPARYQ